MNAKRKQSSDQPEPPVPPAMPATGEGSAVRAFQLDSTGMRRILGSLEADLLEAVWQVTPGAETDAAGWTTIGAVCDHLGPDFNYKTVQTVMNRMVEKGLLLRRRDARAHTYRAGMTHDALVTQVTHTIVSGLVRDFGDVAIAQLVTTLTAVGPEHLRLLEQLAGSAPVGQEPEPGSGQASGQGAERADEPAVPHDEG
jgi:predicted transcriptional regulator